MEKERKYFIMGINTKDNIKRENLTGKESIIGVTALPIGGSGTMGLDKGMESGSGQIK